MIAELDPAPAWVLSGSLMVWGDALIPRFDLVVYLYAPAATRLARLSVRERGRFGTALDPGGSLHLTHLNFMDWAAGYDTGAKGGRSLEGHRAWLAALPCAVLRLDGEEPTEALVHQTLLACGSVTPR